MGSLMAGWDSHVPDPKSVALERNRSFTNEEIEAYWRSKKKAEDDHVGGNICERSKSLPVGSSITKQDWIKNKGTDHETHLERLLMKNAWWRRSNSAFLNEPPVLESSANTHQAQFHVAERDSSTRPSAGHGISGAA